MKPLARRPAASTYDRMVPVISIRVVRRDFNALRRLAKAENTTLSRLVRQIIINRLAAP